MKLYYAPGACSLSPHIVFARSRHPARLEQVDNREKKTKSGVDYLDASTPRAMCRCWNSTTASA